jgi:hypothetical protein
MIMYHLVTYNRNSKLLSDRYQIKQHYQLFLSCRVGGSKILKLNLAEAEGWRVEVNGDELVCVAPIQYLSEKNLLFLASLKVVLCCIH